LKINLRQPVRRRRATDREDRLRRALASVGFPRIRGKPALFPGNFI